MLHIRKEQNDELAKVGLRRFEDDMVVHLRKFFADEYELLEEDGTRRAIQYALERAEEYGIVSERDVCVYTDVMFAFGRNFDSDPGFPWAVEILSDKSLKDSPSEKVDKLYETASANFDEADGIKPESEESCNE
ncbi:MAG: hypothetical protein ACYTFK_07010 [Planctomycetota bacterium]|jgi:hypothetical protein